MARTKQKTNRSRVLHRRSTPSAAARADPDPNTPGPSSATPQRRARKPFRHKPGVKALKEIRKFQSTWKLVIPAAPFIRVVREISGGFSREVSRWTAEALVALQEAAEDYLVQMFEDAMLCTIHAKRVTLKHLLGVSCFNNNPKVYLLLRYCKLYTYDYDLLIKHPASYKSECKNCKKIGSLHEESGGKGSDGERTKETKDNTNRHSTT